MANVFVLLQIARKKVLPDPTHNGTQMDIARAPVIFSGHNKRAVVALCRFFASVGQEFFLIAAHSSDVIFQTAWANRVLIVRQSARLSLDLMANVAKTISAQGFKPCLCPTSEFLNQFFLKNHAALVEQKWIWLFPSLEVYLALSDKIKSPVHINRIIGLQSPASQKENAWHPPCVLKPRSNVHDGRVLYPKLCENESELQRALREIDPDQWFSQVWVEGQSLYLF